MKESERERMGKSAHDDMLSIITTAQVLERDALISYLSFAYKIFAYSGKNLFILLARDEVRHYDLLEDLKLEFYMDGPATDIEIPSPTIKAIEPARGEGPAPENLKALSGDIHILQTAMAHEERSEEFYRRKAGEIAAPHLRSLLSQLADIEKGHYTSLSAERATIQQTGYWFDFPETSMQLHEE